MILGIAVAIGLLAGLIRAAAGKREYRVFDLRAPWLVLVAFIPQFFGFFLPSTMKLVDEAWAVVLLVITQALLLLFALVNLKKLSFIPISLGFLANFLVIILNGGLMPISPETVHKLVPNAPVGFYTLGERLGYGKDRVLLESQTRLAFLDDRIVTPQWMHYPVAFSLGDLVISAGVIWLLWSLGGPEKTNVRSDVHE
jgi:hypothetical protein